jgi:hypothetical protein
MAISATLAAGQRPHRGQELLGTRPVDDAQHRLTARREPDRPQPAVVVLPAALDEAPLDEAVDQPGRGGRRASDGVGEVGDGRGRPSASTYSAASSREAEVELAQLVREPTTSSRHSARPIATRSEIWRTFWMRVPAATTGADRSASKVRAMTRLDAVRRRARSRASGNSGPAAGSDLRIRREVTGRGIAAAGLLVSVTGGSSPDRA